MRIASSHASSLNRNMPAAVEPLPRQAVVEKSRFPAKPPLGAVTVPGRQRSPLEQTDGRLAADTLAAVPTSCSRRSGCASASARRTMEDRRMGIHKAIVTVTCAFALSLPAVTAPRAQVPQLAYCKADTER